MNTRFQAVVALLVLCSGSGLAQGAPSIAPGIETVVSGGYWEVKDSAQGHYRVIIATAGVEHLISQLWVEWVADQGDPDSLPRVVGQKDVAIGPAAAGVHLTNPKLMLEAHHWVLLVDATNTHCDPMAIDRWRIELQGPGSIKSLGSRMVQRGCT